MYPFIETLVRQTVASEREVCLFLGCKREAYQRWKQTGEVASEAGPDELMPRIQTIFHEHRRRYGTRRIAEELRDQGQPAGRRKIARILKQAGLSAIQPRSFRPRTTESQHQLGYSPNLLPGTTEPSRINQLWVGDITYIPLAGRRFCYLATLMDRYSRKIVGWSLAEGMDVSLVIRTLRSAITARQPPADLIHHTDRGGQYAATSYRAILRRAAMRQSMSRAGDCYDNAFMESCYGTIKTELEMSEYPSYQTASNELACYLNYYNRQRKHSAIGYRSPEQFESRRP